MRMNQAPPYRSHRRAWREPAPARHQRGCRVNPESIRGESIRGNQFGTGIKAPKGTKCGTKCGTPKEYIGRGNFGGISGHPQTGALNSECVELGTPTDSIRDRGNQSGKRSIRAINSGQASIAGPESDAACVQSGACNPGQASIPGWHGFQACGAVGCNHRDIHPRRRWPSGHGHGAQARPGGIGIAAPTRSCMLQCNWGRLRCGPRQH